MGNSLTNTILYIYISTITIRIKISLGNYIYIYILQKLLLKIIFLNSLLKKYYSTLVKIFRRYIPGSPYYGRATVTTNKILKDSLIFCMSHQYYVSSIYNYYVSQFLISLSLKYKYFLNICSEKYGNIANKL